MSKSSELVVTESGSSATRRMRVGGIDYLNSLPLLWGLDREPDRIELSYHVPSRLASMLDDGELDVALIPVVAYADRSDYAIVPGIGISSYGGVRSIRLYFRDSLESVRRVGLDTCSRTSALLTRLLFRERWGGEPEFVNLDPGTLHAVLSGDDRPGPDIDGALLIGDAALRHGLYEGWRNVDLGTEWTRWTGLPFVYAFWVCRPAALEADSARTLVERLGQARDDGVRHIDDIVRGCDLPQGFAAGEAIHYLNRIIQYDLCEEKRAAMALYFERLRAAGLLDLDGDAMRFLDARAGDEKGQRRR